MGIHILQLPLLDLRSYLDQEIMENPLLEEDMTDGDASVQEDIDVFERIADEYSGLPQSASHDPDSDKKRLFREMSITKEESLEDHLLWQ